MTTIGEMTISSLAEPAHVKLEKNSKGYNYEISLHTEDLGDCIAKVFAARKTIEAELSGTAPEA